MNEFAFVIAGSGFLTIFVSGLLCIWAGFFPNPKEVVRFAKRMLAFGILLLLTGMLIAAFLDSGEIPPHPVVQVSAAHLAVPIRFEQEKSTLLLILGISMTVMGLCLLIWTIKKSEMQKYRIVFNILVAGVITIFIAYTFVLCQIVRILGDEK